MRLYTMDELETGIVKWFSDTKEVMVSSHATAERIVSCTTQVSQLKVSKHYPRGSGSNFKS